VESLCLHSKKLLKMETEKIKWIDEYLEQALEIAWLEGHDRALKLLERLLFEEPGYARLHNTVGVIYLRCADDLKQAEMHFRNAIKFSPEFAEPYNHLAELLQQEERHKETIEICKQGMHAKKANKAQLLESTAKAWELKRKFGKAIKCYRKALSHSADL
jgi:tetratricopeptide (TPR) repeat protein